LDSDAMDIISDIDGLDWGAIKPSIFGTLFERGLDPAKRSQLGAHYTGEDDILLIVEPVLMAPLRREWGEIKSSVLSEVEALKAETVKSKKREVARKKIKQTLLAFADKVAAMKVLDPACGSANFLYVALRLLLDLQNDVLNFSDEMGAGRPYITVSPAQLYGIETNEYAHELAQMTIQIGYIQWLRDNGYGFPSEPILKKTNNIVNMDAIMTPLSPPIFPENGGMSEGQGGGAEPEWPVVDVIIGNPPFLGGNKIRAELGDEYVDALFKLYEGRVPAFADLVCYWFEKARAMIEEGKAKRAGLLATNSIRGGVNRKVLERIKETGDIFWAQSDRDWILDGAAVRVSMVGFDNGTEATKFLDKKDIQNINSDLSGYSDITQAKILEENQNLSFRGNQKGGAFDITNEEAQKMLSTSNNPNGRPNSDVVRPWMNGLDIVGTPRNMWLIDFGVDATIEEAASYELPFEYIKKSVAPKYASLKPRWWIHERTRPELRSLLINVNRYIVTPHTSKHRVFVWLNKAIIPDHALVVFAREDDYFLGVLQSKVHVLWSLKLGTSLEDRPRYTPSTSFETFPFPWAPGQEPKDDPRVQAIGQAAKELVEQRDRWLNADLTPDPSPKGEGSLLPPRSGRAGEGSKRTLTNLYNARPTWLELAHKRLDEAVFAAYGWKSDLSDEEVLEKLLALNIERSEK
jgi:type II restriction/modification system DNA methylase subunit YeeA